MDSLVATRRRVGFSQSDLAHAVGITRQALASIETRRSQPRVDLALRIAGVLGASVEDLFSPWDPPEHNSTPRLETRRLSVGYLDGKRITKSLSGPSGRNWTEPADEVISLLPGSHTNSKGSRSGRESVFLAGCDPVLGILAARLSSRSATLRFRWLNCSNSAAKEELERGESHFALLHGEMNEDPQLPWPSLVVADWELALIVPKGNPKRIVDLFDVVSRPLRFAVREPGSGVNAFLSRWELANQIESEVDFERVVYGDHFSVCEAVRLEAVDVGISLAAIGLDMGLEAIALGVQRSYLCASKSLLGGALAETVFAELNSSQFHREAAVLGGYSFSHSGRASSRIAPDAVES